MPKGNNSSSTEIARRIEQARQLLDEALALMRKDGSHTAPSHRELAVKGKINVGTIDFSKPMRAFVKNYAANMSNAQKFTLLVAFLTKGDASKRVALADIEKYWNKMKAKSLLGTKFNRLYTAQARENDWVNTEKTGSYHLRPAWKDIFQ